MRPDVESNWLARVYQATRMPALPPTPSMFSG
jgi:hypothetical protein